MYYFQFNTKAQDGLHYVKADTLYQAFDKAATAANGKENVCNLLQVIGARLRDLQLNNFDGRLIL